MDKTAECRFCQEYNAPLEVNAAKETLIALKIAYTILADIRHQWDGRHTEEGQRALCSMRDAIAKAEGRDSCEVQDEYAGGKV